MATRTSYLNLIKPDYTDAADIADINANMDTLDNTIQGLDETGSKSLTAHNNATDSHEPILNAIKAISGMSEYDIAPSKTIAAIIPLLGFGGIVAQKLETNGYVKFANGFTIQNGSIPSAGIPSGSNVNLIIPMKSYKVFMTDDYNDSNPNPLAYSIDHWTSNTYFKVYGVRAKDTAVSNIYGSWLAIGWSL